METSKKCNSCKIIKELNLFTKDKYRIDGFSSNCKICNKKKTIAYNKTKDGVATKIYSSQRGNSKARKYLMPTYTKQELKEWLFSQELFHKLYDDWILSNYNTYLKPSVDRLNDYESYNMDNIRLVTWKENKEKHYADRKKGICNKSNKSVIQLSLDGNFISEFHSLMEAERVTNVFNTDIGRCCLGKRKTAGGFIWKYKEQS